MDGRTPETCDECGFDARDWRVRDAGTFFGALGYWWRLATADVDAGDLNRRPAPGVWSALEYGFHSVMITAFIRAGIEMMLEADGCTLPSVPEMGSGPGDPAIFDVDVVLDGLQREGATLGALTQQRAAPWTNTGRLGDSILQAEATLLHAAHDASHHLMDVARGFSMLGIATPHGAGLVAQVNTSAGGVPKSAIAHGRIDHHGLEGDQQADRKHHGRPFQALCLWSADVIGELADEGHSIAAGNAGENVTLRGIEWRSLRPGSRLRVGSALVELSFPAVPCKKQTRWFADGDFNRIAYERNPQWVRWYGWVREPGEVAPGDDVLIS